MRVGENMPRRACKAGTVEYPRLPQGSICTLEGTLEYHYSEDLPRSRRQHATVQRSQQVGSAVAIGLLRITAPGLGPHLRRDWAHVCAGTGPHLVCGDLPWETRRRRWALVRTGTRGGAASPAGTLCAPWSTMYPSSTRGYPKVPRDPESTQRYLRGSRVPKGTVKYPGVP